MTKGKNKSGNKKKPAKTKKGKAPAKSRIIKVPKKKSLKEETIKTSIPIVSSPPAKIETRAIVVEIPVEIKRNTITQPAQVSSTPVAPENPTEPDAIDLMAKELHKTILSYTRGISKPMLEEYLSRLPKNTPFYIVPRYNNDNKFTIDITDGSKKVTIPSTREYTLVG